MQCGGNRSERVLYVGDHMYSDILRSKRTLGWRTLLIVPELTDDVANELGYEGGIQGMREALRAQIGEGREEMARNQARANLLESLIAANTFEVPPGMVDSNLEMLKDELRYQQQLMGRDPLKRPSAKVPARTGGGQSITQSLCVGNGA